MNQNDLMAVGATRIPVGLSAIIKLSFASYNYDRNLKIISGGGTLEIVPIPTALSGSGTAGWGLGYPVGANEVVSIPGPALTYLAATGATMVVGVIQGYTNGVTVI